MPAEVVAPTEEGDGARATDAERRLVEVVDQLLTDATAADGPDLTRRALAASMTALDATSVRFVTDDGQVLADWRRAGGARAASTSLTSVPRESGRLTVTWQGQPTITARQLDVLATLVGLVSERTTADRHADRRLRQQRRAWGQELHDGVTQSVTAAVMMLERVKVVLQDEALVPAIDDAQEQIRAALRGLRDVLAEVVEEDDEPADDEVQGLGDVVADVRARWRLQARVAVHGELTGVTDDVAAVGRAVVREALINVAKHANARHVTVSVNHEVDVVRVAVADDGGGINEDELEWTRATFRMGLRLMERRVELVGGSLEVRSDPAHGTNVVAVLPRSRLRPGV